MSRPIAMTRPRIFDDVRERLKSADLGFCQLEVNLTTRGTRLPQARHTMRGKAEIADALVGAGLELVSFAGNHCMDWGPDGLFRHARQSRSAPGPFRSGRARTIDEARAPVIVERNGVRIGVVAVNSILPMNYWAEERRPGCAPMRAHTVYEQIEHDQPGTPARVHTFAHREDLAALIADISDLRDRG